MLFRSADGVSSRTVARGPARRTAWSGTWLWTLLLALSLVFGSDGAHARRAPTEAPTAQTDAIALSDLPKAGRDVYQRIATGGPFRYDKDGTTFGNRERQLPAQRRGFYREYTVKTPGARDRGARRIVCGGEVPRQPETCYYSADHYASFRAIVVPKP